MRFWNPTNLANAHLRQAISDELSTNECIHTISSPVLFTDLIFCCRLLLLWLLSVLLTIFHFHVLLRFLSFYVFGFLHHRPRQGFPHMLDTFALQFLKMIGNNRAVVAS